MSPEKRMYKPQVAAVGYWRNNEESPLYESTRHLPDVRKHVDLKNPYGPGRMTKILLYLERDDHTRVEFRGWSTCRICGCTNGTADISDGTYRWPEGLAHYVRDHGVQLTHSFLRHIERGGKPWW